MIVFNLTCGNEHGFEGWFASAADFESQQQTTQLACPVCGSRRISKALHAPHVNKGIAPASPARAQFGRGGETQYANTGGELTQFVENLIANTIDVGDAFPEEARKIHYNEAPERQIRGNASRDEVKDLREEGIEVIALPVPRYLLDKSH